MRLRNFFLVAVLSLALSGIALTPDTAWAHGGGMGGGGVGGGNAGGGAIPGGGGSSGGASPGRGVGPGANPGGLGDRGNRTKRLQKVDPASAASGGPVAPPAPTPAPRRPAPAPAAAPANTLVHLHHGSVRMVAGLARVDLTLEVQNTGDAPLEWRRDYAIDPAAELIGAVLRRTNEQPIIARTLTAADGGNIYAQIRTPPPRRSAPGGNRDPLMVQRPRSNQLSVAIWPIEAQETVRVEFTFVTPLRGHGARRTYVDVMGGPRREATPGVEEPQQPGQPALIGAKADWLMNPGQMVLASASMHGMSLRGEAGGLLHFAGVAATEAGTPRPDVSFLTGDKGERALLVGSGSFMGRIAIWRFDPRAFLVRKGYDLRENLRLRLRAKSGETKRLAPHEFYASDEPRPVTTLLVKRDLDNLRYSVDVVDRDDHVLATFEESLPVHATKLDANLEAAISGWHRSMLVERVSRWAHGNAKRLDEAVRYAVDLGVLVPGTAALAVPDNERRRLTPRNRRIYETDGVPLGAPRHEADLKAPPKGALDD